MSTIDARDGAYEGWHGAVQLSPKRPHGSQVAFGPSPDVPHLTL